MSTRAVVRISEEVMKIAQKYAKKWEVEIGEAVDKLIGTADSRLTALSKYASKAPAKPKKPKADKPAKAPKAAKADKPAKAPKAKKAKKGSKANGAPLGVDVGAAVAAGESADDFPPESEREEEEIE